jgi:dynein heavy chain 1
MDTLDTDMLLRPMQAIEARVAAARNYTQTWLQYQALWDASATVLADRLGKDIPLWQQLLHEIKEARSTVDSELEEMAFGPIVINHRQVQSKINLKKCH